MSKLAQDLAAKNPDDFGGVWIEHEPVYKIVVAFKGQDDRAAVRESIAPQLRRYVQIKPVKTSVSERDALTDRIILALAALNVKYISFYDHQTDGLVIEAGADTGVGLIRRTLPQGLQSFVIVRKNNIPQPAQASGHSANDGIYGGYWFPQPRVQDIHVHSLLPHRIILEGKAF